MASIFTDNFNSYNNGDLNGQGGWSGNTQWQVQTSVVKEGTKAAGNTVNNTGRNVVKVGDKVKEGNLSIAMRVSASDNISLTLFDSINGRSLSVLFSGEVNNYVRWQDLSGYHNSSVSWSGNTWYIIDIEWFSDNTFRWRIDGGDWQGPYDAVNNWSGSGIDTVELMFDNVSGSGSAYFDDIKEIESVDLSINVSDSQNATENVGKEMESNINKSVVNKKTVKIYD